MGSLQKDWMGYRESAWMKDSWLTSLVPVRRRNSDLRDLLQS
jgi:hypothetical protein